MAVLLAVFDKGRLCCLPAVVLTVCSQVIQVVITLALFMRTVSITGQCTCRCGGPCRVFLLRLLIYLFLPVPLISSDVLN